MLLPAQASSPGASAAPSPAPFDNWLHACAERSADLKRLLQPQEVQQHRGYYHTLQEIYQQPATWEDTGRMVAGRLPAIREILQVAGVSDRTGAVVLTGSGSSLFAAECVALALQASLRMPVQAIPAGMLLTRPAPAFPQPAPTLLVSFARSGNSPESAAVIDQFLSIRPLCHHLAITCCREGRLALNYREEPRVATVVLADRTCDRSLVMTSSFTNMVVAGLLLGLADDRSGYEAVVSGLSSAGREVLLRHTQALADVARRDFAAVVYLASGSRFGAARESALKMLEMTGGAVRTFPEMYLGLRHGPMCSIHDDTLVVCFLSSEPVARAYELDLIRELNHKRLGAGKIVVGEEIPGDVMAERDVALECPGMARLGDDNVTVLDVLVGQVFALFRCLASGLRPDSPSGDGVISRVVQDFTIHRQAAEGC